MHPRFSVGTGKQLVRFVVADDAMRLGIPDQCSADLQGDIGQDTGSRGNVALRQTVYGQSLPNVNEDVESW